MVGVGNARGPNARRRGGPKTENGEILMGLATRYLIYGRFGRLMGNLADVGNFDFTPSVIKDG